MCWGLLREVPHPKGLPDVNQVNKTFFFKHRFFMHAKSLFKIKLLKKKLTWLKPKAPKNRTGKG